MRSLSQKEEEREKVKKKEQLEEETLKHVKERMVKEMNEVEDPHPMDTEEDLVVRMSIENLMAWTHLKPNPMLILGNLVDTLRMAGLRANPRHVREFRRGRGQIGMGPDDLPDDLSDDEQPRVKIHPPIFKGTPGERPDAHIYAAEDWMEAMRVRRDDFITKFKHTLNHLAREWYHSLDLGQFRGDWNRFTTHFSRYFSTQGRNIKHLHERWRTFSFDPANDDIEEYIRDVKEAAKQLGHGDDAVINLLKATMPTELYGTLYGHNNLPKLCTMLKDIYARKPQAATSSTTTTPGTSAPFTMIKSLNLDPRTNSGR